MNTKIFRYFFIISLLWLHACGTPKNNTGLLASILPDVCQVVAGEQLALTLDGQIPANTQIEWTATLGQVVWAGQGLTATFLAPNIPGEAVISVLFVSGTPTPYTASRSCTVVDQGTIVPNNPSPSPFTLVISEIMGSPCGGLNSKKYNQYVELYNPSDQTVDVGGWWLFDEGQEGTPDHLIPWSSRSTFQLDLDLVTNSTVIPPHSFAVILSPIYAESDTPYKFPANTVILTVESSQTLGDDFFGIISSEDGYDTLTLYTGGATVIDKVVDTYGTPSISGPYPVNIDDNHSDNVPLHLSECQSAERVDPFQPDSASNWIVVNGGSPGDGPYP